MLDFFFADSEQIFPKVEVSFMNITTRLQANWKREREGEGESEMLGASS